MAKKLDPAEQRAAAALSAFTGKDVVIERIESLPDESGTGQPQSASPKSSPAPDTADMHDQNSGSGLPSPLLGESAQSNPEHVSNPKARKTRKAKKSAPQAEEIEIDDSDAQPLTGFPSLAAAFLPKPQ